LTLTLTLSNVGGLEGSHTFTFKKKLNVVAAPNATGVTSLVKSFKLILATLKAEEMKKGGFLHAGVERSSVTLTLDGDSWNVVLSRSEGNIVAVGNRMLSDPARLPLIVVDDHHPLTYGTVERLSDSSIRDFLRDVSQVNVIQEEIKTFREKLSKAKVKLEEAEREARQLAYVPEDYKKLESEIQKLEEREKELAGPSRRNEVAKAKADKRLTIIAQTVEKLEEDKRAEEKLLRNSEGRLSEIVEEMKATEKKEEEKEAIAQLKQEIRNQTTALQRNTAKVTAYGLGQTMDITECPLCSALANLVNGFKCDFNKVPFETRANVYLQTAKPVQDEVDSLKSKISNLKSRLANAQHAASAGKEASKSLSKDAKKLRWEIKRHRRSIEAMSRALAGKRQLYEKARKDVEEAAALLAEYAGTVEKKKRKIEELNSLTAELNKYYANQTEAQKCRDEIKTHEEKLKELDLKYQTQLNAARLIFNEKAREVMAAVGFKSFKSIKVDDNFKTVVVEEGGCRREIETLSTSEAVTVAILLALAAKKAYLPEFPLFIVDTVTTHYQLPKYKRIIEYLAEQVPYLIVTALSPREDEPIKIVHSWP